MRLASSRPIGNGGKVLRLPVASVTSNTRAGEILQAMEKATGAQGLGVNQYTPAEVPLQAVRAPQAQTYSELGVTYKDAHYWQHIAAMPEERQSPTPYSVKGVGGDGKHRPLQPVRDGEKPPPLQINCDIPKISQAITAILARQAGPAAAAIRAIKAKLANILRLKNVKRLALYERLC